MKHKSLNKKTKYLALAFVVIVTVSVAFMIPAFVMHRWEYRVVDDFNTCPGGVIYDTNNWTMMDASTTLVARGGVLNFTDRSTTASGVIFYSITTHDGQPVGINVNPSAIKNGYFSVVFFGKDYLVIGTVAFQDNGNITTNGKAVMTYNHGDWYAVACIPGATGLTHDIKVMRDINSTNLYTALINDVTVKDLPNSLTNVVLPTIAGIAFMFAYSEAVGSVMLDNIMVG